MRAITLDGNLALTTDYPDPNPGEGECLVRVDMAGICGTDLQILDGYGGFRGVLGHEMVGTVVSGPAGLKGKRVAGEIAYVCRKCDMCLSGLALHCRRRTVMGIDGQNGCFADFIAIPEGNLHVVPDAVSDEEAVFIEPLAAAYQVLSQCPIDSRMTVSVIGPGRLGLLVAQVLHTTGCALTVIGRNPHKLAMAEKKGIQAIHVDDMVPRQDRDVVVDCTGSPDGLEIAMTLVRPRGTIVLKSTCAADAKINLAPIVINEVVLLGSRCGPFGEAVNALARQAIDVRSLITRTYPMEKYEEAFEATRHKQSLKILLKING